MKLLITGARGMLGCDLARAGRRAGHELVLLGHEDLDITDAQAIERALAASRPDALVNCAAWTHVDDAETHPEQARAINATGAGNLARAAAQMDVPLLHVSTDYVFSGEAPTDALGRPRAYRESDPTGPCCVYGMSKREGERQVLAASTLHTVVRSSWLFGVDGTNFVDTMLRRAGEQEAVSVVVDQIGCPTWTGHLAPALIGLVEREVHGLVHLAGAGAASWNELARETFRQAELHCRVEPSTTEQQKQRAPRPAWSALESERADVIPMPDWREGLAGYLAARAGMMRS